MIFPIPRSQSGERRPSKGLAGKRSAITGDATLPYETKDFGLSSEPSQPDSLKSVSECVWRVRVPPIGLLSPISDFPGLAGLVDQRSVNR